MQKRKRKVKQNKQYYSVYKNSVVTDRYGNETFGYSNTPNFDIFVMFVPVSSEVEIAEYGERVNAMYKACLFTDEEIEEKDRVKIGGAMYSIISIKQYPTHREVLAEKV